MDFNYTEEQLMLKDSVRKFSENEIAPLIRQMETEKRTPRDLMKKVKELGFCAIQYPEEYGGAGMTYLEYVMLQEEISRVYCSIAGVIGVNGMTGRNLLKFGTEEQKREYLPQICNDPDCLGSIAFTEAATGSDPSALRTTCVRDGDEWVINGEKIFITNSTFPGIMTLFCKDVEMGGKCTNILVPKFVKGYSVPKIYDKMGMHGMEVGDVVLDNVRVPYTNITGGEANRGKGFQILLGTTQIGKLSLCGHGVGMAQGALEAAVKYSKERVQRGKPISNFQTIQWLIGEMAADVAAMRAITLETGFVAAEGKDLATVAARARLFVSQTAHRVVSNGMQVMGAFGYTTEFPIERIFRDVKLTEIYEGVNEIQRIISAADLLR